MRFTYKTRGTCTKEIIIDIENGIVNDLKFIGGCSGNLQGLSALAIGSEAGDLAEKLAGIQCPGRDTSCPDQLSLALKTAIK